jgi:DNA-binding CsgD family transcriptional regulator/PAS domain-containing protein
MKRRSKETGGLQSITDPRLEKPLLHLHAAIDVDSFWNAVQDVIGAAVPTCFIGLTLQHSPISPRIAKATQKLPGGFFPSVPIEKYFNTHPHRKVVFISDFFSDERHFRRSSFYRGCMAPINGRFAIGLFFWNARRLLAAIIVVRSVQQGELSRREMRFVCHLHAQFQTALGRLRSLERERAERVAFEQFMRRVPLPTILLRWNLRLVYRNQAASEFCGVWQGGFSGSRFSKLKAPLPPEILNQCRVLKKRWEQLTPLGIAPANFKDETVRHPTRHDLRATISLKQIDSAAVARPQFLIEFEDLRENGAKRYQTSGASLSHLARLTSREQDLARLVCDGHTNQEIADEAGLSLETVKKHLHSIFQKLEVPSRSRLITLMR